MVYRLFSYFFAFVQYVSLAIMLLFSLKKFNAVGSLKTSGLISTVEFNVMNSFITEFYLLSSI